MNNIVRYHNYMNALEFKDFTATDFDFFMYLCSAMKEKGTEEMSFSAAELKECAGYERKGSLGEFIKILDGMNEKLLSMKAHLETDTELVRFVLFPTFRINKETGMLTVRVNKDFQFLLNELTRNFTRFELAEFTELSSKYSKTLYRLLKQYKSTGEYYVKVDELRKLLGCPEKHTNKQLMQAIISPAVKELQEDFPLLAVETIRARTKGRPVTGYRFAFRAEEGQIPGQMTLDQAAGEMRRYKAQKKQTAKMEEQRDYDYADLEKQLLKAQVHG